MQDSPSADGPVIHYRDAFQNKEDAARYDAGQYRPGTYHADISDLEADIMERLLRERPAGRSLDFACGTGRMTGVLDAHSSETVGVDIAEAMLDIARERHPHLTFQQLDVTDPGTTDLGSFDTITMFRLLLNNDIDISIECLRWARAHLRPGGRIIANNHGNLLSHKIFGSFRATMPDVTGNVMSNDTVMRLASSAGLHAERVQGLALLGPKIGGRLGGVGRRIEKFTVSSRLQALGSNQIFVLTDPENSVS